MSEVVFAVSMVAGAVILTGGIFLFVNHFERMKIKGECETYYDLGFACGKVNGERSLYCIPSTLYPEKYLSWINGFNDGSKWRENKEKTKEDAE